MKASLSRLTSYPCQDLKRGADDGVDSLQSSRNTGTCEEVVRTGPGNSSGLVVPRSLHACGMGMSTIATRKQTGT